VDGRRRGMDNGRKGRMVRDGGFSLFEKLGLWVYSIENSES